METTTSPYLSIVIPVFNEEGNVRPLRWRIDAALRPQGWIYEVIFVNDGSTDQTPAELSTLDQTQVIHLKRRSGQGSALAAGFKAARGKIVASIDGDGQNDPADIPSMIKELENGGFDVVSGWRKDRKDSASIKFISACGARIRKALFDDCIRDAGCTLRVYRRQILDGIDIEGDKHRFLLLALRARGASIKEVPVGHLPRAKGASKYGASKAVPGIIALLSLRFKGIYNEAHGPRT